MKKRIILFTSILGVSYLALSSYNSGPALNGYNRTGVIAGQENCSSGGCHNGGSYTSTAPLFSLLDGIDPVTTWEPGGIYMISLAGTTTAPKYGFQLTSAWKNGSVNQPAGGFIATNSDTHVDTLNNFSILEHGPAHTATASVYGAGAMWVAPTASTIDTVTFFFTLNNVNGNGNTPGDNSNNYQIKVARNTTSVKQLSANLNLKTYPNPVTDQLNIELNNADNGTYAINVFDMNGKVVASKTANVNKSFQTSINTSAWAAGMYHVQLSKDGAKKTVAVVKQ